MRNKFFIIFLFLYCSSIIANPLETLNSYSFGKSVAGKVDAGKVIIRGIITGKEIKTEQEVQLVYKSEAIARAKISPSLTFQFLVPFREGRYIVKVVPSNPICDQEFKVSSSIVQKIHISCN